jgi:hypothetical protein
MHKHNVWSRYGFVWVTGGFFVITLTGHWLFGWFAESEARRPVIPTEGDHPIRSKAATDSDRRRPPC